MVAEARFDEVLRILNRNDVEFIVVGGVAAILQGSPLSTEDIDLVYLSSEKNLGRLATALKEMEAHYLDPAGRHIEPDVARLTSMKVHLLKTNCGRVDVLRTVGDGMAFEDLIEETQLLNVADFGVKVLNLETIIATKEQAGRPKDQAQLPFLRQLLTEIRRREIQ